MRSITRISFLIVALVAFFSFLTTDSYSKHRTDSPPGISIAQDVSVAHTAIQIYALDQLPAELFASENQYQSPAFLATSPLSRSYSKRLRGTSKTEIRKSYIRNIERFSGFVPRLT